MTYIRATIETVRASGQVTAAYNVRIDPYSPIGGILPGVEKVEVTHRNGDIVTYRADP